MTVLAATSWTSNARMIEACVQLDYLRPGDRVLDPTYGKGNWWTRYRPDDLVASDLSTGVDFRQLPHPDASFDVVAFDPPYVCTGGRSKTTIQDFYDRFGLTDCPKTPQGLQELIEAGLKEVMRVTKPRGLILVKCANYVSGGKLWLGAHKTLQYGLDLGLHLQDQLIYVGHGRPQPARTRADGRAVRQEHARTNWSTLLILQTPRR